jgi:hypothetical protein
MNKDTKILIPEIPGEWSSRMRNGHQNIWNEGTPNEVSLMPPEKGLYAERIDGAWYWVSGCSKCTGSGERWSYVVCDKHNVCIACGTHRSALTETPWGHPDGFICKPCNDLKHEREKKDALDAAQLKGHSEEDCEFTSEIICPCCASTISSDDIHQSQKEMECDVCDAVFDVEVDYSVSYTTKLTKKKEAA